MAYVIPSMRTAPRTAYAPRTAVRISRTTPTTPGKGPSFQTLLENPVTAPTAPSAAPRTMGSVMLGTPVTTPVVNEPAMAPTAQALFGDNPWISSPGGSGPYGSYGYNKYYFATPQTAAKVAQILGGTVVAVNDLTPAGPFVQNQPNQMVKMPDGRLINAGIIASYFDRGWSQQSVDRLINGEIANINS